MVEENKLGDILKREGFKKRNETALIRPNFPFGIAYIEVNSLIDSQIKEREEEIIVHITKLKNSERYSAEFYTKE